MALPTNDSSERDSRPPSRQSAHSEPSKAASRRESPARGLTPPRSATETLASLRADEAGPHKDEVSRDKSRSPPPPSQYGHGHGHHQHYYPYPPPPPPHMYNSAPSFENGHGQWGRIMPPPPPERRDTRGSESPGPGTPGTPIYGASGMPGYPQHNQSHHDAHYPPPPHFPHYPHPYASNLNPNMYGGVQSFPFNPTAGAPSYGPHPASTPYGSHGHGILSGSHYPNGADGNAPLPDTINDTHATGLPPGVNGNGLAAISSPLTHTPIPESEIIYTEDAATKVTDRIRRRCYNCYTSDTSTWRRSNLAVGKVLCNKCGLFERTHARPRPEQFPHKRTSLNGEGDALSPITPSAYTLTPATPQSQQSPEPMPAFEGGHSGAAKRSKKIKIDLGRSSDVASPGGHPTVQIPSHNMITVPSHSPIPPLPPPHISSTPNSYAHPEATPQQLSTGLVQTPHPPQHQPYYGSHGSNHPSSSNSYPHPPPGHVIYSGSGAFGAPPLQYSYPGMSAGHGANGYALPPINGGMGHYHYEDSRLPPPRAGGVPVMGLLNGVDGRGRDSRVPSNSFRHKGDVIVDTLLSGEGGDINRTNLSIVGSATSQLTDTKQSMSGPAHSPRKAANTSKQVVGSPSLNDQDIARDKPKRGLSLDSTKSSEYHSAVSNDVFVGSDDLYTSEEDDDDKSGTYRGSRSARTSGKNTRRSTGRTAIKRQTRTGGASLKRKRSKRASSPVDGGD